MPQILDDAWARLLPQMLRWQRNFRVMGASYFKNTDDGATIAITQATTSKAFESIPQGTQFTRVDCSGSSSADAGDNDTFCTRKYTIKREGESETLATNVKLWNSPDDGTAGALPPRIHEGEMNAGTKGYAFQIDTTWWLFAINETYVTEICEDVEATSPVTEIWTAEATATIGKTNRYDASGGAFDLFLPAVSGTSHEMTLKVREVAADTTAVTLKPNASGDVTTIEGSGTYTLNVANGITEWQYDATANTWWRIG